MTYIKLPQLPKTLAIALSVVGVYSITPLGSSFTLASDVLTETHTRLPTSSLSMPGQATNRLFLSNRNLQGQQTNGRQTRQVTQNPDPGLPGDGAPGRRTDAGTRGICPKVESPLTALVPETSGRVLGLTATERPTFWFYVPYALTSETPVQFVLQDDNHNVLYQTELTKSATQPGVVGVPLPSTAPALEVGKRYYWYFLVFCGNPEAPALVEGWVQRVPVNPELKRELEQATPQESAALYAENNIWHEAVSSLAKLRRENPEDTALVRKWEELLRSVDLQAIAPAPIVECCTPED